VGGSVTWLRISSDSIYKRARDWLTGRQPNVVGMSDHLRFAMICASNVNRSVAAHMKLLEAGFSSDAVESYGVGQAVKLPGEAVDSPNRYEFDAVAYQEILDDLKAKNESFYRSKGILDMLERDVTVKRGPNKWQSRNRTRDRFDIILTFEKRVFDVVVEDLSAGSGLACAVINMEVMDTATEAVEAAPDAVMLCQAIREAGEWEETIEDVLEEFTSKRDRSVEYEICYQ